MSKDDKAAVPDVKKCIGWECRKPIPNAKRWQHFCAECWSHIPEHLQECLKKDAAFLDAMGSGMDPYFAQIISAAANRALQVRLGKDRKFAKRYETWLADQEKAEKEKNEKKLVVLPGQAK